MTGRRIVTAREQFAMLAPWRVAVDEDYRMRHRPPDPEYGASMDNPDMMFPDIDTMPHIYNTGNAGGLANLASHKAIKKSRGNPDNPVTVYRALPTRALGDDGTYPMNTGDWVTPSLAYAHEHGRSNIGHIEPYSVIKHVVPAGSLHSEGNSIHEWAYNGPSAQVKTATPWHSKPGDPTYRVPTQDLQRHRQFNPSIETPEQMHRSLWTKSWDKDTPEYRNFRTDNFSSGGSSEGSTEEGLVEGFESGAKFPPTEITTNGVGAMLTDGNHRVNVADMMSHPDLESYIHYDPHAYGDESYPSQVDPESELGKHIHKLVQNHPYEPVEGGPTTDHVFRRHPATGEWQRGTVDHTSPPHFVDTPEYAKQMQQHVPGFKNQGLGTYFNVDFGNGPEITHERHLHARLHAAGRAEDMHEYRTERHRQEVELEGLTGGHPADIADHFARGGTPLITYKDWLKSRAIGPGEQAASEEEFDPDYVHTPGRGWADMDDEPPW